MSLGIQTNFTVPCGSASYVRAACFAFAGFRLPEDLMFAPLGPFCQSCSMPLSRPDDFGTDEAGYRINDFCRHCFAHGAFTEPALTIEQMLERCVTIMSEEHIMPAAEARVLMEDTLPRLRRWSRERSRPARLA